MLILNCTPHTIVLNSGVEYPPSKFIARVETSYNTLVMADEPGAKQYYTASTGAIIGLPNSPEADDIQYIVSAMVLDANKRKIEPRGDLIAPATGHPDTVRNDKGHILSVPGFII